jgi:hypothetical protein
MTSVVARTVEDSRVSGSRGSGATPLQSAVMVALESLEEGEGLDAGLASWGEGEQLFQLDDVVDDLGW